MLSKDEQISQLRESAETALKRIHESLRVISSQECEDLAGVFVSVARSEDEPPCYQDVRQTINVTRAKYIELMKKERVLEQVKKILRGF